MLNLTHWRLVVSISDMGTISHASDIIGMTQSGASQALAQLEHMLGAALFSRSQRRMIPTAFGESVIEHARAMLNHHAHIRSLANEQQGLGPARLTLGSFPSVISRILPKLLSSFRQRYPDIEVVALEGTDKEIEEWLGNQHIDVGVVLNPAAERDAVILGCDTWVALLPVSHALARRTDGTGIGFSELAHHPFILATGGCHVHAQSLAQTLGLELTDIRVTVQSWESACALVREGIGIAVVPESTLPECKRGLRALPLEPPIKRSFGLVKAPAAAYSKAADVFFQYLSAMTQA
ncbi:LysR family transcriptional regulator [Larsenimonas rhizosphaerae]|uniref:LysR family transcriptional regulator n=1 Tax=Larsenimonas rhizosphaerae TaxID=2944682 RepID=UPI0020348B81|nr:LysR family transcriptional regulator [Larsenimonas rhizosphaerae]MCM2130054.1 LysR family transcriptional regulator [Larsenimonas rhizosphaerae]